MTKQFSIGELFTRDEVKKAAELYSDGKGQFAERAEKQIVKPAMVRINKVTGQENHPRYMAYALEHACAQAAAAEPSAPPSSVIQELRQSRGSHATGAVTMDEIIEWLREAKRSTHH